MARCDITFILISCFDQFRLAFAALRRKKKDSVVVLLSAGVRFWFAIPAGFELFNHCLLVKERVDVDTRCSITEQNSYYQGNMY